MTKRPRLFIERAIEFLGRGPALKTAALDGDVLSVEPSTASMVPRMRTGGVCCAQATVVRTETAASAAVIQDVNFGMALSPRVFCNQLPQPRGTRGIPRQPGHIGGVSPSRPTLTRLVSKEPSGSCFMKAMTLAPALRSDLSAGT